MKSRYLALLWTTGVSLAADPVKLPMELGTLKTTDGRVYDGVKVVGEDAVGIRISHEGGTARVPFGKLPKEVASRFTPDPEAAKAQLEKEAREMAANDQAAALAAGQNITDAGTKAPSAGANSGAGTEPLADEGPDNEAPDIAVEGLPKTEGKTIAERVTMLRNYIAHLKAGIVETEGDVKRRKERAQRMAASAHSMVAVTNPNTGRITYRVTINQSRVHRAEAIEKQAGELEEKIGQANQLIMKAESEIARLKASAS